MGEEKERKRRRDEKWQDLMHLWGSTHILSMIFGIVSLKKQLQETEGLM